MLIGLCLVSGLHKTHGAPAADRSLPTYEIAHAPHCAMLAYIYHWFTEGFDTADLKDAQALLDQLAN